MRDPDRCVVLASRNPGKVAELNRILAEIHPGLTVLGSDQFADLPDIAETGETFADNAVLKATAVAAHTGMIAIADDSGLTVDALNGMPGVLSARWAGRHGDDEANLQLVLDQMSDVPDERRSASFRCAAAACRPGVNPRVEVREGEVRGHLTRAARGDNGFGYDPVFVPEGFAVTTAQMAPADKDAISHRSRALRALIAVVSPWWP
jgi:XTP/dITP diphosphohydrolase